MLERFSSAARAAVTHARTEAQGLQHGGIGAEHLLLGVLHEDAEPAVRLLLDAGFELPAARTAVREAERGFGRADAAALESIGIDLAAVLEKVEEGFGPGALSRRRGRSGGADSRRLRFDNGARKVLERAVRAAGAEKRGRIEAAHLLLGLLDEACPARRVLEEFGLAPDALRQRVRETLLPQAG